ncbi:class IV adenylate cyclase [Foetidibacter luteolus]|uniref:class IV adenylate cyclase n=1 Tax=Foetidibacter luteolus TaxID=2608880 RepID=UPI00129ABC89|nr:class IV adenylate cyclase [Foetidibacter luteolus]
MNHINVEIKAKCFHLETVEAFLFAHNARYVGTDYQQDTYFNVPDGRLKLRQGNIENSLIFYRRDNQKGPKQSDFQLVAFKDGPALENLLSDALGIKTIVKKTRRIFYLHNVKVHLDELEGLGNFVEIEAGNLLAPEKTVEELHVQCRKLMKAFDIQEADLIDKSYSDMLLEG